MTANLTQKGQTYGKSSYAKNTNSGKELICQICLIPGHGVYKCKNKFNQGFVPGNRNFGGGFRPRGGQNFRGFAGNNQIMFRRGSGFTYGFNNFGPRFCSNFPRQNVPFYGYVAY